MGYINDRVALAISAAQLDAATSQFLQISKTATDGDLVLLATGLYAEGAAMLGRVDAMLKALDAKGETVVTPIAKQDAAPAFDLFAGLGNA